ncbi:hypothetical protein [Streptomyces sp. NPDC052225]|uniref:hypothetical protein n=1 Tax=Streptomyces sp. NPDC052225 TaxID=3154949 RepID=UPI00342E0F34
MNAFDVAFACCALVCGSVADIVGRVRVFAPGALVRGGDGDADRGRHLVQLRVPRRAS